jgi:hypothetical protein
MLVHKKLAQFVEIINYKQEKNVIMETKLDAKLVVFPILASLVLELLALHQSALLLVEMVLRVDQKNVIMETKLDAKLAVFPILASLVLELSVLHQSALVLLIYVETRSLVMANNVIMVIKLVA